MHMVGVFDTKPFTAIPGFISSRFRKQTKRRTQWGGMESYEVCELRASFGLSYPCHWQVFDRTRWESPAPWVLVTVPLPQILEISEKERERFIFASLHLANIPNLIASLPNQEKLLG